MKKLNKKGIGWTSPASIIGGVILLVVVFTLVADLYPTLTEAGDDLNASGIQFGTMFASDGVLWIVFAAALLLAIIGYIGIKVGKK